MSTIGAADREGQKSFAHHSSSIVERSFGSRDRVNRNFAICGLASLRPYATGGCLAILCAVAQMRLVEMLCNIDLGVRVAEGVLAWRPEWPVYQSRLLAPFLLRLLGHDRTAYLGLIFVGLVVGGWLSWNLAGLAGLGIYHAAFAVILGWMFYPWDILDPAIFMVFVTFVAAGRSPWWFVGLYVVAILNRYTGQFIAGWMIADPLCRWLMGRRLDRKMLASGVTCLIAGTVMVWEIQGRTGWGFVKIDKAAYLGNYFQFRLGPNLRDLDFRAGAFRQVGFHVTPFFLAAIYALILTAAGYVAYRDREKYLALGLIYFTILAAIPPFSIVGETRVYLDFISLLVLAAAVARQRVVVRVAG